MDAHKALNRIAAQTAVEVIDGAHVHHLDPDDRDRVAAFMRGSTEQLRWLSAILASPPQRRVSALA